MNDIEYVCVDSGTACNHHYLGVSSVTDGPHRSIWRSKVYRCMAHLSDGRLFFCGGQAEGGESF